MAGETAETERGRDAGNPAEIGLRGWRDVLLRVVAEVGEDNVGLISAGVAYYALFAIFPALAALVSIYGLVADPHDAQRQIGALPALPESARQLLTDQLQRIAAASGSALGWGLAVSVMLSIYSATRGVNSLILALNIAYEERGRSFVKTRLLGIAFTLAAILLAVAAIVVVVAAPVALQRLPIGSAGVMALEFLPWLLLAGAFFAGTILLYRYAPHRRLPKWRWVFPGALLSTVLWVGASLGLSFYVARFENYNRVYGSVGAVVVLLLWFYLTSYIVVVGAELNAELEHQTRRDTTRGPDRPMGERGAYVADNLGKVPRGPWRG